MLNEKESSGELPKGKEGVDRLKETLEKAAPQELKIIPLPAPLLAVSI